MVCFLPVGYGVYFSVSCIEGHHRINLARVHSNKDVKRGRGGPGSCHWKNAQRWWNYSISIKNKFKSVHFLLLNKFTGL